MSQPTAALASLAETSVRQLIVNGKFKTALDRAKELHKAEHSSASEALLLDAYAARIRSLLDTNLPLEARSLLELVRERFPLAKARLDELSAAFSARAGLLDELLAPLNDPELSAERRAAIEQAVQNTVTDLAALAACRILPEDHALRAAAAALDRAFDVVTSGPVTDEQTALPEVSHRSPLASWKSLVRAIACFYRGEGESCVQWLGAIKPESVPARLVSAMHAMLGTKEGSAASLTPAAATLVSRTIAGSAALRKQLEELEEALDQGDDEGPIVKLVRATIQECRRSSPDKTETLRRLIFVRADAAGFDNERLIAALEGKPRQDATFFRMLAHALETSDDPEDATLACGAWDQFRQEAVREGWFPPKGVEVATLYLHMAGVLNQVPEDLLSHLQRSSRSSQMAPEEVYFLFPEKLYERACTLDPHPESFSRWLHWAAQRAKAKGERVAQAWHKIRPKDIDPLLYLMQNAEKRDAFPSALGYLDKAEQIDAVHSVVRAARLRLLARSVLRHLQKKKPHLAAEKLAAMEALPQFRQGDRPAFLAALRYLIAFDLGDRPAMAEARAEGERLMGGMAAEVLVAGLSAGLKRTLYIAPPPINELTKADQSSIPAALARIWVLVRDLATTEFQLVKTYLAEAAKQFPRVSDSLDTGQLRTLAEMALAFGRSEFAYAVSGAGLSRDESMTARFLLLRARSVPEERFDRRAVCAAAAAELARPHRDMEVVDLAVELVRVNFGPEPFSLTPDQAAEVLRKEKAASAFPKGKKGGPDYSKFLPKKLCNCPKCRFDRGEVASPFDEDDIDEDEMKRIFDKNVPDGMPPEIAGMLFDLMKAAYLSGDDPEEVISRVLGDAIPGTKSKKGRRK